MHEPSDRHTLLEPFVGTFRAEVTFWMGPDQAHESSGTMVNSWTLGGRFLRQVFDGDSDEALPVFQGEGYWGYNTVDQRYEGLWIDNASTMMQFETGQVDEAGKIWTMTGTITNPQDGRQMEKRTEIVVEDADHHHMTMWFTDADGNETRTMRIRFHRAGG